MGEHWGRAHVGAHCKVQQAPQDIQVLDESLLGLGIEAAHMMCRSASGLLDEALAYDLSSALGHCHDVDKRLEIRHHPIFEAAMDESGY